MRFRLHSAYVNNFKEENPFCNIFLLWDTQKNMNLLIWSKIMTFVFSINAFRSSHQTSSIKKLFLKISQNSQKNICVGVSSNMDLFVWIIHFNLTEYCEIFKNANFGEHLGKHGHRMRGSLGVLDPPFPIWVFCPFYISENYTYTHTHSQIDIDR